MFTFPVDLSIPPANVNCVSHSGSSLALDSNLVLCRTLTPLLWQLVKKRPSLSRMILELKVFKLGFPVPLSVYISVLKNKSNYWAFIFKFASVIFCQSVAYDSLPEEKMERTSSWRVSKLGMSLTATLRCFIPANTDSDGNHGLR